MKLTKKIDAEIKQVMNDYWTSYFEGNLDHWANYLVDDYKNIGGTEEEIWNSKKEILDYTYRVIDQMQGATELRNKQTEIIPYDPYVMVHELLDIYIKIEDEWTFYQKFRLSSLIQKTAEGWKVLHQHGSYPDSKTTEGEAFAFDTLKSENQKLQKAIKERTIELEQKNRELAIEAALERVRARAMAMQTSEELRALIGIVFSELKKLDILMIGCVIMIFDPEDNSSRWWMVNSEAPDEPLSFFIKYHEYTPYRKFVQAWKERQLRWEYNLKGSEKKEWDAFLFSETGLADMPAAVIQAMRALDTIVLSTSFNNFGCLNVGTVTPLTDEQFDILLRFAKVFDLTYTRFNDLKQAEAQAREAKIETAVERVRAQSMAMYKTSDLYKVNEEILSQLNKLKVDGLTGVSIYHVDENDVVTVWDLSSPGNISNPSNYTIKYDAKKYPILGGWVETWKTSNQDYFVLDFPKEVLIRAVEEFKEILPEMAVHIKNAIESGKLQHQWNPSGRLSDGLLAIDLIMPPTEDTKSIVTKMAGAFNLAYQRFQDLQKAEAQAREAQIQLAMERVRARTMAMQKSNELAETASLLFKQIGDLGIETWTSGFNIWEKDDTSFIGYNPSPEGGITHPYRIPSTEDIFFKKIYKAKKRREDFLVFESSGKSLADTYSYMKTLPVVKDVLKGIEDAGFQMPAFQINHCTFFAQGFLLFITLKPYPDAHDIFKRFGKVFEQTYTRFLDLQKAEAQAREAQIELGLERVRARSMAMQKSEELSEISFVLFQQLKELGVVGEQISIGIFKEAERIMELYATIYGNQWKDSAKVQFDKHEVHRKTYAAWKEQKKSLVVDLSGEALDDFNRFKMEETSTQYKSKDELPKGRWVIHIAFFSKGCLFFSTHQPHPKETIQLLERFASVFDLTYTRFLDLQKAEAQARKAEIELGLERVRAKAMGMQHSEHFKDVIEVIGHQLHKLGLYFDFVNFIVGDTTNGFDTWNVSFGQANPVRFFIPYINNELFNETLRARKEGLEFNAYTMTEEETFIFVTHLIANGILKYLPEEALQKRLHSKGMSVSTAVLNEVFLTMANYSAIPYTYEEDSILNRFGTAFQQAYTRFLDLQKAEEQTREAKIEVSLERVRSRAMAMHKTDELLDAAELLYKELTGLGITSMNVSYAFVDDEEKYASYYSLNPVDGKIPPSPFVFRHTETEVMRSILSSWKKQESFNVIELDQEATLKHQTWVGEHRQATITENNIAIPFSVEAFLAVSPQTAVIYTFHFTQGYIFIIGEERLSAMQEEMVLRFTKVFEMTYRRFLDLQKAEAQAREAQIELGLERVRARAMAMHRSDDLQSAVEIIFEELDKMNLQILRCGIGIIDKEKRSVNVFTTAITDQGKVVQVSGNHSMDFHPMMQKVLDAWMKQQDYMHHLAGKELSEYYKAGSATNFKLPESQRVLSVTEASEQFYYMSSFQYGGLYAFGDIPFSKEATRVMKRFASVFNLTYKRFLDLQQAEAQTREAKIEASLERVRASAMAMHNSNDVGNATGVLFTELEKLDITTLRCGIYIVDEQTETMEVWRATTLGEGKVAQMTGRISMTIHPMLVNTLNAWKQKESFYSYHLSTEDVLKYYKALSDNAPEFSKSVNTEPQISCSFFFKEGGIFTFAKEPFSQDAIAVLKKFASVFGLTYRRYLDLKDAEARTQLAIRQSSLDRIRAEIASMRTSEDLQRITPSVWKELLALGVPFFRCGVFIINEKEEKVHIYLSTPDGKPLAVLHLDFTSSETTANAVASWRQQKVYREHWNREQFMEWVQSMIGQGHIETVNTYQAGDEPPESLTLHFVPFAQGMMYVGSADELSDAQIDLVQALADAFSTAYARYEDFTKLEEAKSTVEKTLTELKATQTQLIQSEKMASLGELTAGIAHEIQNPLNFVNNFSEVNKELISEMKEEIEKGNIEEAKLLADDLIDNQEKINHHGKRADAIVKGMLQHSRSSSGKKEPTDINALADEYFRLSYHGLRAKDKSFNATTETHLDETLEKVNIIPQDIGRVLLNLFTNAFYAVSEKKKQKGEGYEPTVTLSTKKSGDKVEIRVKDNGMGIPQKVLDKIFQPFFTTKPTGHGTGLGLSLSYDIIKAHGGEIKVETKEKEETQFTIILGES